jgi:hypothetical protein
VPLLPVAVNQPAVAPLQKPNESGQGIDNHGNEVALF